MSLDIATTDYSYSQTINEDTSYWMYKFHNMEEALITRDELYNKIKKNRGRFHETHIDVETFDEETTYYKLTHIHIFKECENAEWKLVLCGRVVNAPITIKSIVYDFIN